MTEQETHLKERARELAQDAGRELMGKANTTGAKMVSALGEKIDQAAGYVERRGPDVLEKAHVPVRREQIDKVAGGLHGAARYLKQRDPQQIMTDIDHSIQAHPYRALGVGLAVGWLVGRMMRRD